MDLYNIITKIPHLIMLGVGLVIILNIHIGGLQDISVSLDGGEDVSDRGIIADGILSLQKNEMDSERGIVHAEFFTDEAEQSNGCFIPQVPRLDGDGYSYEVYLEESSISGGQCIYNSENTNIGSPDEGELQTSIMIVESNGAKHNGVLHVK